MNKAQYIGRLTRDPELRTTQSGKSVCSFSLAVPRSYTSENEERKTDFIDCVAWRGIGETIAKYVKKGHKLAVCGRMEGRQYEDRTGNKRAVLECIVEDMDLLEPKRNNDYDEDDYNAPTPQYNKPVPTPTSVDDDDIDIPF